MGDALLKLVRCGKGRRCGAFKDSLGTENVPNKRNQSVSKKSNSRDNNTRALKFHSQHFGLLLAHTFVGNSSGDTPGAGLAVLVFRGIAGILRVAVIETRRIQLILLMLRGIIGCTQPVRTCRRRSQGEEEDRGMKLHGGGKGTRCCG